MKKSKGFRLPRMHKPAYLANRPLLIERGREANTRAYQHRDFKVSVAVLAYRKDYNHPGSPFYRVAYAIFVGVNIMPIKGGPKICAEQVAIGAARAAGYDEIVAICVVGEKKDDDANPLETATLHPCWNCRTILGKIPEVKPETVILTIRTNSDIGEEQSFEQLCQKHANGNGEL